MLALRIASASSLRLSFFGEDKASRFRKPEATQRVKICAAAQVRWPSVHC